MCSWIEQGSMKIACRLIQPNLCCLNYRAVQWLGCGGSWGFSGTEYRYLSIHSNISEIIIYEITYNLTYGI